MELAKNSQLLKTNHLDKHKDKMDFLYFIFSDYSKDIILMTQQHKFRRTVV